MNPYYPVRIARIAIMLSVSLILLNSCNKFDVDSFDTNTTQQLKTGAKVSSTISGFVTDETEQPVAGATVKAGTLTTHTDQFGYFEIKNTQVTQNAAMVTVIQPGYFKGIKTYIATEGQAAFFRIKLIPKTTAGTVNGNQGGTVALYNGLSISFMPGGVITASAGTPYTGTINVAASWINPVAGDLDRIMPGDLRGIEANGDIKGLTTFGMAAIELTGTGGELLQIAPGKTAALSLTLPASVLPFAPASIPLWYLDEGTGLWTEQGTAVKKGNTYTGEVSHFSFWNFDQPHPFVHFSCTVKDAAGKPVINALVKISMVNNPNAAAFGFTNGQGYVSGAVPANSLLNLEIKGDEQCGTSVYSQQFSTNTNNIDLGTLIIDATAGMATVSGSITGCNNKGVTNGSVIMIKNDQYYRYTADQNGSYSFSTPVCNTTASVDLIGYDATSMQYTSTVTYLITAGRTTTIDLQACGNSSSQFIIYTINGITYSYTYPADNFAPVNPDQYFTFRVSNNNSEEAGFQFSGTDIMGNSPIPLSYFMASQVHEPYYMESPVGVNLTERGENDQVFAGNFSGIFRGTEPGHKKYTISCRFRVKCNL